MAGFPVLNKRNNIWRIIFWTLAVLYVFILPEVIFVYNVLTKYLSSHITGKIPVIFTALLGFFYIIFILYTKRERKSLILIIPCAVIICAIIFLEPNPNKHIHIPEYILMSYIFYRALSVDYRGRGILILVLLCSSFAGVIDEIEQGILPSRFYGWSDMIINFFSALIGVLILHGLHWKSEGDWNWIGYLKRYKGSMFFILSGLTGSVLTCVYLFQVKSSGSFHGVYPIWIFIWNILYLPLSVIIAIKIKRYLQRCGIEGDAGRCDYAHAKTAYLWILSPMLLLFILNSMVLSITLFNLEFS